MKNMTYRQTNGAGPRPRANPLVIDPFLQFNGKDVYNPLTGKRIDVGSTAGSFLSQCAKGLSSLALLSDKETEDLAEERWVVENDGRLEHRYVLRYVSLESHTVCNQSCYFCPVSTHPRESEFMPDDLYASIVRQLAEYRSTIAAVFMMSYNEPTLDPRFVDHVRALRDSGLTPAANSNGTGLTPDKALEIRRAGGLGYLEINLSTLDRDKYERDRGGDHLAGVLRNLDYLASHPVSDRMEISVLGHDDEQHRRTVHRVATRYAGTPFRIRSGTLMDRAGNVGTGARPASPVDHLGGCDNTGSRTVEHLHVTPDGRCVVCCQDYFGKHVVGDLSRQTLDEVLAGDEFARIRRWTYGMEPAPRDFICRGCTFAVSSPAAPRQGKNDGD